MIMFDNEYKVYTELANNYIASRLDVFEDEYYDGIVEIDYLKYYFPKLVFIEDKEKCLKTFLKIGEWSRDKFSHRYGALEKYVIIRLFDEIDDIYEFDGEDLICCYLKKDREELLQILKKEELDDVGEDKEMIEKIESSNNLQDFFNSDTLEDLLFFDLDEEIFEEFGVGREEDLSYISDYFYDVLPSDIVDRAKKSKELYNETVDCFVDNFKEYIEKSFYRIKSFSEYDEKDFQLVFELYARSFNAVSLKFEKVFKEVEFGNGRVDFIVSFPIVGEILFEIKIEKGDNVKNAIIYQVPEYLNRIKKDKAFLIIFSNNDDNSKYLEMSKKVYDEKEATIYPFMINISPKTVPSKIK